MQQPALTLSDLKATAPRQIDKTIIDLIWRVQDGYRPIVDDNPATAYNDAPIREQLADLQKAISGLHSAPSTGDSAGVIIVEMAQQISSLTLKLVDMERRLTALEEVNRRIAMEALASKEAA